MTKSNACGINMVLGYPTSPPEVQLRLLGDVVSIPRFAPTHIVIGESKRVRFSEAAYLAANALGNQRVGLWNRHTWEDACSVLRASTQVPNEMELRTTDVRVGDGELLTTFLALVGRWRPDFAELSVNIGLSDSLRADPTLQRAWNAFPSVNGCVAKYYLGLGPLEPWTYLGPVMMACLPTEALIALGARPFGDGMLIKGLEDPTCATPVELVRARHESAAILRRYGVLGAELGVERKYGPNWPRPATWTMRNVAIEKWMEPNV